MEDKPAITINLSDKIKGLDPFEYFVFNDDPTPDDYSKVMDENHILVMRIRENGRTLQQIHINNIALTEKICGSVENGYRLLIKTIEDGIDFELGKEFHREALFSHLKIPLTWDSY